MANNPKLQVFRIDLKPKAKNSDSACYRNLLLHKLNQDSGVTNDDLWKLYWENIVKTIDLSFYKDEKNNKAFSLYEDEKQEVVKSHSTQCVLEGIIKGGKYNRARTVDNVNNKGENPEEFSSESIFLDQFYFMLYTPLDSTKGILLLQTYTEDSIFSAFSKFLTEYFRDIDNYFDLKVESYVPEKIKDEYQKTAKLKGFSFTRRELIGNVGEGVSEDLEEFDITIKITPKKSSSLSRIKSVLSKISKSKFNEKELNQFSQRVYLTKEGSKKGTYYDLEKDISSIKPTIYLEDRVSVSISTGLPDFDELKKYCFDLLVDIIREVKNNESVNEVGVLS